MHDLLLVAYEFPPSGGAAVQRIAKYARFLSEAGWCVRVICAEPAWGTVIDHSLTNEVQSVEIVRLPGKNVSASIARAIDAVRRALRRVGGEPVFDRGSTSASSPGSVPVPLKRPLSIRVARWLAVPDDAVGWARTVAPVAARLHAERPFSAVLASGPPYSALVAGARIGEDLSIPFVADMRDAWRDHGNIRWPTSAHRRRSEALERKVMMQASAVVLVSEGSEAEVREMGASRVLVVPNGFDSEASPVWGPDPDAPLEVVFLGRLAAGYTDPQTFLQGLALAVERYPECQGARFTIIGPEALFVHEQVRTLGLEGHVDFCGFLPHAEALARAACADVGLINIWDGQGSETIYCTKLFEYLGIGIPILLVGPLSGVASRLIERAQAGLTVECSDVEGAAQAIRGFAVAKAEGRAVVEPVAEVVARYDRKNQVLEVARLLDGLTGAIEAADAAAAAIEAAAAGDVADAGGPAGASGVGHAG